jgi:predicted AlkP superfamily pyrophosphatase or phosphodiesterase
LLPLIFSLQKFGPKDTKTVPIHLREIDQVIKSLINYYESKNAKILILSEYGISPVDHVIPINQILRNHGYVQIRRENGGETLDCGASEAFAVTDHQIAHVYIKNKKNIGKIREIVEKIPGIESVLDSSQQKTAYFAERSGDLVLIANESSWFSYYYWNKNSQAPDFARCVAIHRKPGYDPAEMFFRFNNNFIGKLYLFFKILLIYVLHLRATVDVCPLDGNMVKGSHGRVGREDTYKPVFIAKGLVDKERIRAEDVHDLLLKALLNKD